MSEIRASIVEDWPESYRQIGEAVPQITAIEILVDRSRYENESGDPEDIPRIDETLSQIQASLEVLLGSMMYSNKAEST